MADALADHSDDCGSSPESPSKKRKSLDSSRSSSIHHSDPPFRGYSDPSANTHINKHWREKICEWAYQGTFSIKSLSLFLIERAHVLLM